MNDKQLLRYNRHILLPQIDLKGQEKILASKVLIVGCGGLGSAVAPYLSSSGVGHLTLLDDDIIDLSNLQRQIQYRNQDVGKLKVETMAHALNQLNPETRVTTISERLSTAELITLSKNHNAIVDCSDNITTRLQLNEVCLHVKKPLIFGSAIRFEGQLTVFDPKQEHSPCLACFFGKNSFDQDSCSYSGIFAPLVGIIGAKQAAETLKLILGIHSTLIGTLYHLNALTSEEHHFHFERNPNCHMCKNR
ncbi:Molybdopterin-synthase adenylyltransferase [Commensalibacter sp. Nvir]|uniref:HesA/MoeB/ThiF family protein n=1 Tax=Commensalibacter sp. Nvir TaxID=3069817 RepID=UPI002D6D1740|nr:Molybdopterin-synthase adenylyltransferase [Commensalibacter sp. Nvir]